MLGEVGPTEAVIWVRVNEAWPVVVEYGREYPFGESWRTEPQVARPEDRRIVKIRLTGLLPGTEYYYKVWVNGEEDRLTRDLPASRLRTAPAGPARFRVAFGSCVEFMRYRSQPVWTAIERSQPDLFFWLGDNIYGDSLEPETLFEEYMRQREVPEYQALMRSVPQWATWDDHDYGLNNHNRTHTGKGSALEVFKAVWANPEAGLPDTPGTFFRTRYGGVDFFFLDNRTYADPQKEADAPGKTHLGAGQLAWLKAGLLSSTAPFKVLINGSGWSVAKGRQDSWANRLHERNDLFRFIQEEAIGGVILLSGDTHLGEMNCIPWSERGGYDLYEFVSSGLAAPVYLRYAKEQAEIRLRDPYIENNYGVLDFDLTREPATVRFSLMNHLGRYAWYPNGSIILSTDDLKNGQTTWADHIDPALRAKMAGPSGILEGQP